MKEKETAIEQNEKILIFFKGRIHSYEIDYLVCLLVIGDRTDEGHNKSSASAHLGHTIPPICDAIVIQSEFKS